MKKRVHSEEKLKRLVRDMPPLPDEPRDWSVMRSLLVLFFTIVVVCWVLWSLPLE